MTADISSGLARVNDPRSGTELLAGAGEALLREWDSRGFAATAVGGTSTK